MLKYDYRGRIECLKNTWEEITIADFERSLEIESEYEGFEYWLELFQALGLSEEFKEAIDFKTLTVLIKDFKKEKKFEKDFAQTFECEGYTYRAHDGEFNINAKEFADMEKLIRKNYNKSVSGCMAILFKREDLGPAEHKTPAHLKHKADLFREHMPMSIVMPYIMHIGKTYLDNAKILSEDVA